MDCIEGMKLIEDKTVDCIITDLPYNVTKNKWDIAIPFDVLWKEYERIIKDNGAIILFGQGLFTAKLMLSNEKLFRYTLVWDKEMLTGHLNANRMPMRQHEDICVFYKKLPTYNPQMTKGLPNHSRGNINPNATNNNYGAVILKDNKELGDKKHPTSIIRIPKLHASKTVHPTQKPEELIEYLIRTYTNESDLVLDSCMGSGTLALASINTKRSFIGFEKEVAYFDISENRVKELIKSNERDGVLI